MKKFYMDTANASLGKCVDIQFMDSITPITISKISFIEGWEVICDRNIEV